MVHDDIDSILRSGVHTRGVISLAGGLPAPETFPRRALADAARDATLDLSADPLQYHWPEGRWPLRALIASRLRARGADVTADDVVVTNGAQDAMALTMDILCPKQVQVDAESYPVALDLFRGRGCTPRSDVTLPFRYVMPAISNPHGHAMSKCERERALEADWLLEDDAYAELRFDGQTPTPLLAEARDRVFHVGSFSKILSPGLRVGWLVPPREWLDEVRAAKARHDVHTSTVTQAMVERMLRSADFDTRLERLRDTYERRCERMVSALRKVPGIVFEPPQGGFSVWVETDLHGTDTKLLRTALRGGVVYDPGSRFFAESARRRPLAMRLNFSGVAEGRIAPGIERLAKVLSSVRRSSVCRAA